MQPSILANVTAHVVNGFNFKEVDLRAVMCDSSSYSVTRSWAFLNDLVTTAILEVQSISGLPAVSTWKPVSSLIWFLAYVYHTYISFLFLDFSHLPLIIF